jgi:hypothetical protein
LGEDGLAHWHQFPQWIKGPARIEEEEIVLDGGRAETYYIHEPEDLLFDLTTLYPSHPNFKTQDAVRFVRRHGLLWHGPEAVARSEYRESLEDWWYAGATLSVTITLYKKLMEGVETGSAEPVRSLGFHPVRVPGTQQWGDDEYELMVASMMLASQINERLADCSHAIAAACGFMGADGGPLAGPGLFMYDIRPPNLESAAYAHLAQLIVARAEIKDCPGCGRPFTPESGKQKYHSPSCASTSRGRRFREKRRSGNV